MMRPILGIVPLFVAGAAMADVVQEIASPDRTVVCTVTQSDDGIALAVALDGETLLDCPLGMVPAEGEPLGPGLVMQDIVRRSADETWTPVWGTEAAIRDYYNEAEISFKDAAGRALTVVVRAGDDAVAFRYRIPGEGEELGFAEELTAFRVTADAKAWAQTTAGFRGSYEDGHVVARVSELAAQEKKVICLPLTLEFPSGKWAALTEAHLVDYGGLYLQADENQPDLLKSRISTIRRKPGVIRTTPFDSPWRVVLLGRTAGDLIESNAVASLNPPSAIEDPSWIRPGKVIWDWWCKQMVTGVDFEGGMNTATLLHFAKFAAESGLDHLLIDEGWSWWANIPDEEGKVKRVTDITRAVPEVDLPAILDYCNSNGVGVWLWLTWGHCKDQIDEAFPLYEEWGVAGVKVDFMNSDDQWMVNWYHEVAEKAAKHKLMVDMHGAYKPTGMSRTWPNMMTFEGVKGLEHIKWSAEITPGHNLILPFTRMLAGPMDYTPGGFNVITPDRFKARDSAPFVMGTLCHQLAQYVVYESPIQMCVDYPDHYRGHPGFPFLQWVPTTWDKTIVLGGYPGEFISMARQHGGDWYVGCMANESGRELEIPLDFLGAGEWTLDEFADGARADEVPEQIRRATRTVTSGETLKVTMAKGGGYAARLQPR